MPLIILFLCFCMNASLLFEHQCMRCWALPDYGIPRACSMYGQGTSLRFTKSIQANIQRSGESKLDVQSKYISLKLYVSLKSLVILSLRFCEFLGNPVTKFVCNVKTHILLKLNHFVKTKLPDWKSDQECYPL
jgi:hypothetical protein